MGLTVCGGVIRQYDNFDQNYDNFSKIFFSVYNLGEPYIFDIAKTVTSQIVYI